MDFSSPCVSITRHDNDTLGCTYEDISDTEQFENKNVPAVAMPKR